MKCPFLFLFICICPVSFQSSPTLLFMFICNLLFSFVMLLRPCPAILHYTISSFHPSHSIAPPYHTSHHQWMLHHATACQHPPASRINESTTACHQSSIQPSVGEVNGRVDQLASVQQALQDWATPTMIAGFAMILAQMQAQAAHPEVLLTITSSIGPLERSATFRDGAWHGYDLTHNLIDPRSHMIYGEPTMPPMDQERSFRISPPTIQPLLQAPQPHQPHPPAPPQPTTFECTLPLVPPPILTPPMPLASESVHSLTHQSTSFMFPSAFQGGRMQVSSTKNEQTATDEQTRENSQNRTFTFKDSYEEVTPSSSRSESSRLIGFQKDPKLRERQREQQRTENKNANAPIDLRDKINAGKRAREQSDQSSSKTSRGVPAPSPSQPEARRLKVTRELLTATEIKQLDITARDAVRLQREIPNTPNKQNPRRQKFESATSKEDHGTQRTIEKSNIGVLYIRPVKQPVFTNDGTPPWFERLRRDLQRDNSSYLQPIQTMSERLTRQRPGRCAEIQLQLKTTPESQLLCCQWGKICYRKPE